MQRVKDKANSYHSDCFSRTVSHVLSFFREGRIAS